MLTNSRITILVFTDLGLLRDSIFTILASIPNVMLVDIPTAERYSLREIYQLGPDIIIYDCDAHDNFTELVQAIKISDASIKCVAISGKFNTSKLPPKESADYVLLKGFSRREIDRIVQEVFLEKKAICNPTDSSGIEKIEALYGYQ